MKLRNAWSILFILRLALALAAGQNVASSASPVVVDNAIEPKPAHLKISFTGHLLGYYRLPEWQTADFQPNCPLPQKYTADDVKAESDPTHRDKLPPKTPADAFLSDARKRDEDILVGMGDNFGVTLESRTWRDRLAPDKLWQIHAKSRDLLDKTSNPPGKDKQWADPNLQIGDNVGCFFSRAGYDAIVPGKDDFYFGPERLRAIAKRLANVDENVQGMHKVRMLAANLVLKTDYLKKPAEISDADKDLKFVPGMPTGIKSIDISDNGTLPPFARQIRFQVSSSSLYSVSATAGSTSASKASLPQFSPFLCPVDSTEGLDKLNPSECEEKHQALPLSDRSREEKPKKEKSTEEKSAPDKVVWDFNLPVDWPPRELPALYGLCTKIDPADLGDKKHDGMYYDKKRKDKGYYCQRFTVVELLFSESTTEPWVIKRLNKTSYSGPNDTHAQPTPYAVIFGIVDKDLTTLVGRDNLAWRNTQPKTKPGKSLASETPAPAVPVGKETYGTTVDTLDEATTLGIAVRNFDLFRKAHHLQPPVSKILLAQMTRGKAETLAANLANTKISDTSLRFDVVIAAATDFSAATADEEVIFQLPSKIGDTTPQFRQFVAVPWRAYDSENSRVPDPVRSLTLTDSNCDQASGLSTKRTFAVGGHYDHTFPIQETIDKQQLEDSYDGMGRTYLSGKNYWHSQVPNSDPNKKPTLENAFQLAVLAALRDRTHADVSMLQKRAFYWGPFPEALNGSSGSNQPSGELLERILWMGDYLEVLSLKGSTLKKVLDDSDKLDGLDEQATQETVETSRGLLALGIEKTRDKQYLVDGMQLDPNRLYTVATSNHIAAGDNGYPELADPQFADQRLPGVDKDTDADDKTPRISSLVCQELGGESCVTNPGLLFANVQQLPSQLQTGLPAGFIKAYVRSVLGVPELPTDGYNRTNYQAQLNPTWRISLKDLSFNLSSVRNNLSEVQRTTELTGVTEPAAGNAKSHAIDFSTHAEWVRSGKWVDEFIRALSEYQDTVTGNTAAVPITATDGSISTATFPAPALVARSKNQGAIDAGFFWHPGGHKYFDKLGMVLEPIHVDSQLASQELQFPAVYDTTGNITIAAINLKLPPTRNILQRLAFRAESDKSHFEIGYQGGWERNALESLNDNIGSCPALNLTSCLQMQEGETGFLASSISLARATRERYGPYADLDWTWPLIWKFAFRTQDSFQYFGPSHLDNPIDTLYRNDVTETLNLKLLPNLSIGPSLERFDYENKINHVHLRTWSPSIKLTYSFDWLKAANWKKSLRYSPSGGGGE